MLKTNQNLRMFNKTISQYFFKTIKKEGEAAPDEIRLDKQDT